MKKFIKTNPLVFVLIVAIIVRLMAVIWSKGFIHSDDHYETVAVACDWLVNGLRGDNGYLHWKNIPASDIGRFPLYTIFLYLMMKVFQGIGITSLNSMMYGIRLVHALISLLPVWVVFRVVHITTGKEKWALIGGLIAALHFVMPFLGVRNLIEMVGGNIWIVAIYYLYRYQSSNENRWLYWAGLFTGLAWMIRFQIAFAVLPIPIILWYERRRIQPAVHYCISVGIMLIIAGIVDLVLLGRFAGSTITNLQMNTNLKALYNTIPLLYPAILLVLFIPPFSLLLLYLAGKPSFFIPHKLLVTSSISFVLCHSLLANQQERFIFPIIPAFILIGVLALWNQYQSQGYILKNRQVFAWMARVTIVINVSLLALLSFSYSHKGFIEPLVKLEQIHSRSSVLFVQPNINKWIPIEYGGRHLSRLYIRKWDDLKPLQSISVEKKRFDYFVLYPQKESKLNVYLDSVQNIFGLLEPVFHVKPSLFDYILNKLNPKHNRTYEAYVYKPKEI